MTQFRKVVTEIHRRSLWQVLGVYALTSWVIWQVVVSLYEGIGLPDWVPGTALVLLLIGLPIVLATAFVQEGAPSLQRDERRAAAEGLETTPDAVAANRPGEETTAARGSVRGGPLSGTGTANPGAAGILTWTRAVTAAVLAFAALGLAATGFMGMRALGIGPAATLISKGVIEARSPIVLADFENRTEQEHLGATVTEALRVDLAESPAVRVLDPGELAGALRRMGREPGPLDATTALEFAVREGHKAVITGEVSPAGAGYVLTARILTPRDQSALLRFRETARGPDELIPALDRLSRAMRERIGEPLRSLRAAPPLEQVTTASLDALELYTRALRVVDFEGDHLRAVELLERAVERDTAFAMAYRKLNAAMSNMNVSPARRAEARAAAYRHRDRLGPRERGLVTAAYHAARGERALAASAYEEVLARYPDEQLALSNLASQYRAQRRWDEVIALLERATGHESAGYFPYRLLAFTFFDAGRTEDAWRTLERMKARHPDNLLTDVVEMYLHSAPGDYDTADSVAAALAAKRPGNMSAAGRSHWYRSGLAQVRGRLAAAETHFAALFRLAVESGLEEWLRFKLEVAEMELFVRGDPDAAVRRVDELRPALFSDSVPPLDRPYTWAARIYAQAGAADRARELLSEYRAAVPDSLRSATREVEALSAGAEGDWEPALAYYREGAESWWCTICAYDDLGRIHDRLGQPDSAIANYERYVHTPYHHRQSYDDDVSLPFVLERLGELHERSGNRAEAARYYGQFMDLWADADPELQPRVAAARRALERLTSEQARR